MTVEADVLTYLAGSVATPGALRQSGALLEKATDDATRAPWAPEGEDTLRVSFASVSPQQGYLGDERADYECELEIYLTARTVQLAKLDDAREKIKTMMAAPATSGYPSDLADAGIELSSEETALLDNGLHSLTITYTTTLPASAVA